MTKCSKLPVALACMHIDVLRIILSRFEFTRSLSFKILQRSACCVLGRYAACSLHDLCNVGVALAIREYIYLHVVYIYIYIVLMTVGHALG